MRTFLRGSAAAALLLIANVAFASTPVSLTPQYGLDGDNTVWLMSSTASISGAGTPNPCLTSPTTFAGAVDGSVTSSGDGDAFDGGFMLLVDGVGFTVAGDTGTYNGTDTVSAGPTKMSGLYVGVRETALATSQTLRMLVSLKNGSAKSHSATVVLDNALGDSAPQEEIDTTSSGDATFTTADRWIITNNNPGTDATPTLVFYGKGKVTNKVAAVTKQPETDACTTVQFNVKVPAHSARYLLFFAQVHTNGTNSQTETDAAAFNSVTGSSDLMAGISTKIESRILNWKF